MGLIYFYLPLNFLFSQNVTEASNLNRRQIEQFTDRSTYKYSTELELSRVDEGITGMYDCQVRDQESGVMKGNTFIYIYAAGNPITFFNAEKNVTVCI